MHVMRTFLRKGKPVSIYSASSLMEFASFKLF